MADVALPEITTKEQACVAGSRHYFTGKPCHRGHIAKRLVSKSECIECQRENFRVWRMANPGRLKELKKCFALRNPEKFTAMKRRAKAKAIATGKDAEWKRKHRLANLPEYRAAEVSRREKRRNATPSWAKLDSISEYYAKAIQLSAATGNDYHVDHIVPLRGKNVCGLHVENNLQVLTAVENYAKSNRF